MSTFSSCCCCNSSSFSRRSRPSPPASPPPLLLFLFLLLLLISRDEGGTAFQHPPIDQSPSDAPFWHARSSLHLSFSPSTLPSSPFPQFFAFSPCLFLPSRLLTSFFTLSSLPLLLFFSRISYGYSFRYLFISLFHPLLRPLIVSQSQCPQLPFPPRLVYVVETKD